MKTRFKVGDRVRFVHEDFALGEGEVVEVKHEGIFPIRVKFFSELPGVDALVVGYYPEDLELAETPIERMKRLYSED